jgi:hypothetical protein
MPRLSCKPYFVYVLWSASDPKFRLGVNERIAVRRSESQWRYFLGPMITRYVVSCPIVELEFGVIQRVVTILAAESVSQRKVCQCEQPPALV